MKRDSRPDALLDDEEVSIEEASSPRRSVLVFARLMEKKLQENDHKGGWDDSKILWLLSRMLDEVCEALASLKIVRERGRCDAEETIFLAKHHVQIAAELLDNDNSTVRVPPEVLLELADVANFAMMVTDLSGHLRKKKKKAVDKSSYWAKKK